MTEALHLALFDLRTRLRGRATVLGGLLSALGLALALTVRPGDAGALATSWYPWVLGALGFAVAAGSAATLPADRAEGRATWLATLAPSGAARRLGAALAGMALCVGATLGASAAVGALAPAVGAARTLRDAQEVALPALRRFRDPARGPGAVPLRLALTPAADGSARTLELSLRPILLLAQGEPPETASFSWSSAGRGGTLDLPLRARLVLDLPDDAREVTLVLETQGVDYAVREALLLGRERPFVVSLLWLGLLLGLCAAALAPFAVAVSRATSAPTAAAATLALVALAGMRAVLPDLEALPTRAGLETVARALVRAAVALAPDLGSLSGAAAPSAGRALGPGSLVGALALLPHLLASVGLLLLPGRGAGGGGAEAAG